MMQYTLHIIRKPVKNLRLKILDAHNIQAIAPKQMTRIQIQSFVKKKQKWIEKHLTKLKHAEQQFYLEDNQILLHGEPYTCMMRTGQGHKYLVDHKNNFVRRGHDLVDETNTLHRYKTYAKKILTERLATLARKHSIEYDRCFIRDQKTKRGSCSSLGHIGLNRRLVKMPQRVADYIIIHELAHRKQMDHSPAFRDYCTQLCPKTPEARVWLKQFGRVLH